MKKKSTECIFSRKLTHFLIRSIVCKCTESITSMATSFMAQVICAVLCAQWLWAENKCDQLHGTGMEKRIGLAKRIERIKCGSLWVVVCIACICVCHVRELETLYKQHLAYSCMISHMCADLVDALLFASIVLCREQTWLIRFSRCKLCWTDAIDIGLGFYSLSDVLYYPGEAKVQANDNGSLCKQLWIKWWFIGSMRTVLKSWFFP